MHFRNVLSRRKAVDVMEAKFPTQQLFVLALCRICEPIAFMSIFPYIYYMVESFNITHDSTQIAIYAGMVTSSFALAEFSTSVLWGRLSDRVGRKPVLLGGLAGTAISMIIFGFSTNLPMALLARALGGILNGNIAVLQTTVAELVTVKEHQPRAYSIMPFVWCLGSIVGPALGGALAQPAKNFPSFFSEGSIFATYPFLLSNLICVAILCCGLVVGILFLEETHPKFRYEPDLGVKIGHRLLSLFQRSAEADELCGPIRLDEEKAALLADDSSSYRDSESSSSASSRRASVCSDELVEDKAVTAPKAFTKSVVMNIVAYGLIAYHAISFDQMMPIFLSSPTTSTPASSLVKFTGGFGFSSQFVGSMLAVQGFYSMFAQIVLFPYAVRKWGALKTFRITIMVWPLLYLLVPYIVFLPSQLQTPGIMFCLIWRITAQCLAFPSMQILIANSAPSMLVLGMINGVAASTASLARAFGPTLSGSLFSVGLSTGYVGLAWWVAGAVAVLGALQSLCMIEAKNKAGPPAEKPTPETVERQ